MAMRILGISTEPESFSAAVVLENRIVSAIEQFKIREHWSPKENALLPREAIHAALKAANVDPSLIDVVAFTAPVESADIIASSICRLGLNPRARLEHVDRRLAHAAAAFYCSPFDRAVILILDIGSSPETTCVAVGAGAHIEFDDTVNGHRTLASLYGDVSRALGFDRRTFNKVAWLGVVGEPEFLDVLREGIHRNDEDKNHAFIRAIDLQRPHNVAASLQALTNERVIQMAEELRRRRNISDICVAGHLAENPILVRELEQNFGTGHVFIPPAPGFESLSIGAALARSALHAPAQPQSRSLYPALGPEFSDPEIKAELDNCKLVCSFLPGSESLIESASEALAAGSLVGWFQGRCEFGHRALGFRSIVANPFTPYIDENINRFLKHRESFHPFVISVPEESASEYFHQVGANARTIASLYVVNDRMRELLSRFTIQNVYVRVHTVSSDDNHLLWTLLHRMRSLTGHPLLINTSFNLPGEPLVLTPRDAIRSFFSSGLDLLAIGRFLVTK